MAINAINPVVSAPLPSGATDASGAARQSPELVHQAKPAAASTVPAPQSKDQAEQQQRQLKEASKLLNDFLKDHGVEFRFQIDDGQVIVKVLNKETGDLIRQIPSEEAVKISKALDTLRGLIIKKTV